MSALPNIENRTVSCGEKLDIDAFDEDGNPVTYQVIATPPKPASGGGGGSGAPSGQQGQPGGIISLPPPTGGTAAKIIVIDDEQPGWAGSDVFINRRLFRNLAPGARRDAMVWNVKDVKQGRLTLELPEGMGEIPDASMMFVIGMEMPGPQ